MSMYRIVESMLDCTSDKLFELFKKHNLDYAYDFACEVEDMIDEELREYENVSIVPCFDPCDVTDEEESFIEQHERKMSSLRKLLAIAEECYNKLDNYLAEIQ